MKALKSGDSVSWISASGRRYSGKFHRLASPTAAQVVSRDGFRWLLPLVDLAGADRRVS